MASHGMRKSEGLMLLAPLLLVWLAPFTKVEEVSFVRSLLMLQLTLLYHSPLVCMRCATFWRSALIQLSCRL